MRNTSKMTTLENKFPLLAVEHGCIISKDADITVAFEVELPELYTVTGAEYEAIHGCWCKAIKVLPDFCVVHKQDWFIKEKYKPELQKDDMSFLSRSFERHFNERPYLKHSCYLYLTKTTKERNRMQSNFSTLCRGHIIPKELEVDSDDENAAPSGGHSAVYLMVARDEEVASEYGAFIDTCNQDRKNIDRSITQQAHELIERNPEMKARKSTVIYNPKWMKGIVGIVASRLIETYYRPTVVLTMSNGFVTGSARSVPGFDLYQAVESCSDLLENFGGHIYAAGLTMRPENVDEFTRRFNEYVERHIDPQMLIPQVEIDSELLFSDITPQFRSTLNRFQPFGPGNNSPVFVTRGVSNRV